MRAIEMIKHVVVNEFEVNNLNLKIKFNHNNSIKTYPNLLLNQIHMKANKNKIQVLFGYINNLQPIMIMNKDQKNNIIIMQQKINQ